MSSKSSHQSPDNAAEKLQKLVNLSNSLSQVQATQYKMDLDPIFQQESKDYGDYTRKNSSMPRVTANPSIISQETEKFKKLRKSGNSSQHKIVKILTEEEEQFLQKMKSFIDSYGDIFSFSKEKIDNELKMILQYFYANSNKINLKNVDLVDDALSFHERREKNHQYKVSDLQEHTKVVNEIITNLKKNNLKTHSGSDEYVSQTEKEVRGIMDRYRIQINRSKMKNEGNKGVNKCKDNKKAFYEYKLGRLFLRTMEQDNYEQDQERKKLVQRVARKLKKDLMDMRLRGQKKNVSPKGGQHIKGKALHILRTIAMRKHQDSGQSLNQDIIPPKGLNSAMLSTITPIAVVASTKQHSVSSLNDYYSDEEEKEHEAPENQQEQEDNNENGQGLPDLVKFKKASFKFNNMLEKVKQRIQKNQKASDAGTDQQDPQQQLPHLETKTGQFDLTNMNLRARGLPGLKQGSHTTMNTPQKSIDHFIDDSLLNKTIDEIHLNQNQNNNSMSIKQDLSAFNITPQLDVSLKNTSMLSTKRKIKNVDSNRSIMITNRHNFSALHPKVQFIHKAQHLLIDKKALPVRHVSVKRQTFISPTPSIRDSSFKEHFDRYTMNTSTQEQSKQVTSVNRGKVKNLIHACLYLEQDSKQNLKNGIHEFERDQYIEELRQDKLNDTIDLLREIEIAENPKKLKQIYMYKIMTHDDYLQEQRVIKTEYRSGLMDPSREVARIEKKRNNKQTQSVLKRY
ncbi:UNKNOWN [Stylonychia lemnae]|uniref:Uncharacterized protein n=1 Tax=Stylonychia lemnae TaxID=5949 RepID=A0A078AVD3_STYLE|nr:UNKNOWN [Stylonychia lemnae]|eukprot:CDW86001.1 UNKNOWN [Stylonychia lemnae]